MLAGIFSRTGEHPIQAAVCERLQNLISRNPDDKAIVFSDSRCFLAKIDIGAYGEPAFHIDQSGSVSMLAGEPLLDLDDHDASRTRTQDLELLNQSWDRADWDLLTRTRGVFCAVHYQPRLGRLHLISDKLGERPLYFWANDEVIIFSSTLRVLEGIPEVPKEMDLRAVTEITAFGYSIGDRTPYTNIVRLRSGEVVQVSENSIARFQYWRWDAILPSTLSEDELLRETFETFTSSVSLRIRKDTTTMAFLSGGLDTRCVVAALRAQNVRAHTFTFEPDKSQDRVLRAAFARQSGTFHHEGPLQYTETGGDSFVAALADAWKTSKYRRDRPPERPQLIWTGDGGSTGAGCALLSTGLTELLRAGKRDEAIDFFLREQGAYVVARLFKSHISEALMPVPREAIRAELDDIHCKDPVRAFHIFLMLNDQRHHMSPYYENIDLHRFDFQLPFYDGKFLQLILAIPINLCLRHRFYMKWFALFPPVVKSVPWQTYPGHEPCPLPIPKDLSSQWDPSSARELKTLLRPQVLRDARAMLGAERLPSPIFNKWHLRLTSWIHWLGLRDYGYVIQVAKVYYKYWVISTGKYVVREWT